MSSPGEKTRRVLPATIAGVYARKMNGVRRPNETGASEGGDTPALEDLFGQTSDAVGVASCGIIELASSALSALLGYDGGTDLVGKPLLDVIAPESRELVFEYFRRRENGEETPPSFETVALRRDGTPVPVDVRSTTFRRDGAVHSLTTFRLTAAATEAKPLQRDADFYRAVFQVNTAVKLLICPSTGQIVDANPAAVELYGWSLETLRSMRITDINTLDADEVRIEMENARRRRRSYFEFRHRTASGAIRHVEVHSSPLVLDGASLLLSIIHDVTERDALEEQLRRAQRLDAMGQLAGGLAHDFNNLLGILQSLTELLAREVPPGSRAAELVEEQLNAGREAASLTRALLAFGRREPQETMPLDVNAVVRSSLRLLTPTLCPGLEIITYLADGLPLTVADPNRLEQVVINLALNARDAMNGSGKLTIRTRALALLLDTTDAPAGHWVVIDVTDEGVGMDEATMERIFEPLFTTKPEGKGTGLGLSTAYGIVAQSGGHIAVSSEVGRGSTFSVFLPAFREPAASA